jgi:lipoprotein signal peptidase
MSDSDVKDAGAGVGVPGAGSARWDLCSHLRLWPVAAIALALDLWTKHWAFTRLPADPSKGWPIIPHLTSLQRSLNSGALFGLGKGLTPIFIAASFLALGFVLYLFVNSGRDRRTLHIGLALVLAGALGNLYDRAFSIADVVNYQYQGRQYQLVGKVLEETPMGLLVGFWPEGANGKEPPRIIPRAWEPSVRQLGVVRDFIRMEPVLKIGSQRFHIWPWVFNVADVLLVVGVGLLMLNFWIDRRATHSLEAAAEQSPQASA